MFYKKFISIEDPETTYVEWFGLIRIIYKNGKYKGWYRV